MPHVGSLSAPEAFLVPSPNPEPFVLLKEEGLKILQEACPTATRRAGDASKDIESLSPKTPIPRQKAINIMQMAYMGDKYSDQAKLEAAIEAQTEFRPLFNEGNIVRINTDSGLYPKITKSLYKDAAREEVGLYMNKGKSELDSSLFKSGSEGLDVGSEYGYFEEACNEENVKCVSIEPRLNSIETEKDDDEKTIMTKDAVARTLPVSFADWSGQNKDKKLDFIHIGNISPLFMVRNRTAEGYEHTRDQFLDMFKMASKHLKKGSPLIVSINPRNPELVSSQGLSLRPLLSKHCANVLYWSAKSSSPNDPSRRSIGGAMGVFVGWN